MTPTLRVRTIVLAMAVLCVSACGSSAAVCANAGGTYAEGTCIRAGQAGVRELCAARGAVYLAGPDTCAYGEGR